MTDKPSREEALAAVKTLISWLEMIQQEKVL